MHFIKTVIVVTLTLFSSSFVAHLLSWRINLLCIMFKIICWFESCSSSYVRVDIITHTWKTLAWPHHFNYVRTSRNSRTTWTQRRHS